MDKIKELEALAIEAHKTGQNWHDFTQQHSRAIKAVEPVDRIAANRMTARLLIIVAAGPQALATEGA